METPAPRREARRALSALSFVVVAASSSVMIDGCTRFASAPEALDADADVDVDVDGDGASDTDASDDDLRDGAPDVMGDGSFEHTDADADGDVDAGRLIAFVTGNSFSDIVSPKVANTKCSSEAQGRLPGRFVAWYSDANTTALARLVDARNVPVRGPWYRVDGKRIVASREALVQTASTPLENAIDLTAAGEKAPSSVWTATLANGAFGKQCPELPPTTGTTTSTDRSWTEQTSSMGTCGINTSLALYCFQVE